MRLLTWRSSAQIWASCTSAPFVGWAARPQIVVLDNLKEGVLTPDIYDPALNPLYRDVLAHYGVVALPCRVGDPDRKGKVEAGIGHAQKTPLKGLASRRSRRRRRISIAGKRTGPTRGSTAPPNARSPRCLPRNARRSGRCRSNRFATTASARARCISMAASKSRPPTTARRPAGSGSACRCSGTTCTCG